jgi:hypothetical protein
MKLLIKILLSITVSFNFGYAKEILLYPVYSKNLDKINIYYKGLLYEFHFAKVRTVPSPCSEAIPHKLVSPYNAGGIILNLNNLLKFQDDFYNFQEQKLNAIKTYYDATTKKLESMYTNKKIKCSTDDRFRYTLLGKIIINDNNKLKYNFFDFKDKQIQNKIFETKKTISYINDNNFSIDQIKKLLNVDLINENLGKKVFNNKQFKLTTKEAMNNLINCRICEQIIDSISNDYDDKYKSLFGGYFSYDIVLFNDQIITNYEDMIKLLKDIQKKGNIYNQLNERYIAKTYKEWKLIIEEKY